ncbi:hypothetical protein FB451DRAFT_1180760 [Mycena latifolia]|nr:hypothetical protein FB451DRAFT_1180760 [Mycena latifolia]
MRAHSGPGRTLAMGIGAANVMDDIEREQGGRRARRDPTGTEATRLYDLRGIQQPPVKKLNGSRLSAGPREEGDLEGPPSHESAPAKWFQSHVYRIARHLRLIPAPAPDTVEELVDDSRRLAAALGACNLCAKRPVADLSVYGKLLARALDDFNNEASLTGLQELTRRGGVKSRGGSEAGGALSVEDKMAVPAGRTGSMNEFGGTE